MGQTEEEEEEVFYDPIDAEIKSPRRISKRISGIQFLIGEDSVVEPGSHNITTEAVEIPTIKINDEAVGDESEEEESKENPGIEACNESSRSASPAPSEAGSETSRLRTASIQSNMNSTLLQTLEMTGQSRSQRVRVKTKGKSKADMSDLHLVQQLAIPPNTPVYVLEFSPDGVYVAAGCGDGIVRVWATISEQILPGTGEADGAGNGGELRLAAIFTPEPVQSFTGHEGEVLDLSWSTNNLLLSGSTDGTARLWSPTRPDCLAVFPHTDIVTSLRFHPTDDRLFISGSFDCRLRLWNIEERRVVAWNELPGENVVTAVGWSGGGRYALAGSSTGVLLFFETEGFKYYTQILVKSSRGKNSVGRKISSICIKPGSSMELSPPLRPTSTRSVSPSTGSNASSTTNAKRRVDDQTILVSSNDSRLRAYLLRDKSESVKYSGHENETSQIRASYSDDAEYLVSGSEDGRCIIWTIESHQSQLASLLGTGHKRVDAYEYFQAATSGAVCTAATFAPSCLQGRLQAARVRPVIGPVSGHADGKILVTADDVGRIRVFENNRQLDAWLNG